MHTLSEGRRGDAVSLALIETERIAPLSRPWSRLPLLRAVLAAPLVAGVVGVAVTGGLPAYGVALAGLAIVLIAAMMPGGLEPGAGRQEVAAGADRAVGGGAPAPRQPGEAETWRALVEAMPDAAVVIDDDTRVVFHNALAADLFPQLRPGRPITAASRNPGLIEAIDRALAARPSPSPAAPLTVEIAEHVPIERRLAATLSRLGLQPGEGPRPVLLVTLRDLTEQNRLDQMRQDFIANASHELRTPLASLRGCVDTLQGAARDDPVGRQRFLDIMNAQALRMTRLIDDLLSLSRVEMKQHLPPRGVVDLNDVVTYVAQTLEPLTSASRIRLSAARSAKPARIRGEREEIAQALLNLAQNAVKYGREGGRVEIRITRQPGTRTMPARIAVAVEDDGPGIAPEHLPRLTERFYRVNVASSREKGGTGLGLAIVKHVVLRHRGELKVVSEVGKGSVFTIEFEELPQGASSGGDHEKV